VRRSVPASLIGIVAVAVLALGATLLFGDPPQLGLDLQGGAMVVLEPEGEVASGTLDQAIEIIRNRVDGLGVAEPEIYRQGNAIVVALPGVDDQERALELVGQTAELRFRPVLSVLSESDLAAAATTTVPANDTTTDATVPDDGATTTAPPADSATDTTVPADGTSTTLAPSGAGRARSLAAPATTTAPPPETTAAPPPETTAAPPPETTAPASPDTTAPPALQLTPREQDVPEQQVVLPGAQGGPGEGFVYVLGPAGMTGRGVQSADAVFDSSTSQWAVSVVFRSGADGIDAFNRLAAACYNASDPATCPTGQAAITLDGEVVSAPTIQQPSFARDQVQISGNFGEREAKDLALVLRYGSLPVQLEPQAVQTVSATLGKDSLRAGVIAGLVGLVLVVAFLVFYYRMLGLVALAGLALSAALMWSLVAYLSQSSGLTLTLAGATGIIVSIGVTVDSYVVYFERLKDEVQAGRTLRASAERGFSGSWRTILAANLASLIGAVVLYWLTVGAVRGFAFFLAVSTVLDIVVAYFFTRPVVILLARRLKSGKVMGVTTGELATAGVASGAGR